MSETVRPAGHPELSEVVEALRRDLRGEVITSQNADYDVARRVWNAMFDTRLPAAVLRCADEADVVAAVRRLQHVDAPLAIRGGGHHVAGFGGCDGGFVIDLGALRTAIPTNGATRVRVGGGALLHDVDTATSAHGRAVPLGVVSETGVAGLALSGGVGWLTRRYGYTCDNLVGARVVTADGEIVHARDGEADDLLWGLRGGGGNFGVVTEFEFLTRPVDPVLVAEAYHVVGSAMEIETLLRFYRDWSAELSGDVTAWILVERAGPAYNDLIPDVAGQTVVGFLACALDVGTEGRRALDRLCREGQAALARILPMRLLELQHLQDGSGAAAHGMRTYMKGEMLRELTDEMLAGIADRCLALPTPESLFEMGTIGGAMAERGDNDAAVGLRDARYLGGFSMMSPDADRDLDAAIAWTRDAWRVLLPGSLGGVYLNFAGDEGEERVLSSLGAVRDEEKRNRLVAVKRRFDPSNRFRINHNIDPGGGSMH